VVDMPERYVNALERRRPVAVKMTGLENLTLEGRVQAILPLGNADARTIPVRVETDNPGGRIRGGMALTARFQLSGTHTALLVPKDAVVASGNQRLVYIVRGDKVAPAGVRIKGYYGSQAEIEGRLAPGDQVVIRGNERLRPGQAVAVTK